MFRSFRPPLVLALLILLWASPLYAFDPGEKVEFHGFGGWGYGQTDGNVYLNGNEDGNYDNFQFALALNAKPTNRLRINAQAYCNFQ